MVSDEIMEAMNQTLHETSLLPDLQKMLQLADGVKFAKAIPLPDENSSAFQIVYDLVEQTKINQATEEKGGTHA